MMITNADATRRLCDAGLRLTPQRRALLEELAGDTSHPAADALAARVALRVPGVSLSTVYKGLHELADLGLLRELDLPGANRFDPNPSPHAHLVCEVCESVVDVELPPSVSELLLSAVSSAHVSHTDIVFHGRCAGCVGA